MCPFHSNRVNLVAFYPARSGESCPRQPVGGRFHARYEPVDNDEIIVAQLRDERLKHVLDAEAAPEVGVVHMIP